MFACGCLFALVAASTPRFAMGLVWLLTDYVQVAFEGFLLPLLGLFFLPYTTLFFVLSYNPLTDNVGIWGLFFIIFGFFLDLGSYASKVYMNRDRIVGIETMSPSDAVIHVTSVSSKSPSSKSTTK